jgi:predicted site-specific integrase-resolvase
MTEPPAGRWIYPSQAAQILSVTTKTVNRWDTEGKLERRGVRVGRTLGGHRRFLERDVQALARQLTQPVTDPWNGEVGS